LRKIVVLLGLAAAAASPALAQSNRGAFGLDAMVAPTTGVGFAYYITDGLSVRPWLGLGYSGYNGFYANVGAQARYEFGRGPVAPYLSAVAQYSHNGSVPVSASGSYATARYDQVSSVGDLGQLGGGAGVRFRLSNSLSLFGEGRFMYTTVPMGAYGTGWSTVSLNDQTRFDAVLGLTYLLR
jgi:hypothetical protein